MLVMYISNTMVEYNVVLNVCNLFRADSTIVVCFCAYTRMLFYRLL